MIIPPIYKQAKLEFEITKVTNALKPIPLKLCLMFPEARQSLVIS
jgi:hypothetical protein